ncbi:S-layer homology domain-containing protein [Alkalinema pantanalense CENA528]|uniref:S-layer homology domain-containing protein n=1 Tax=Alkalinema pantanalense TaxID=1620705 RepID=UPI003D6F4A4F
MLRSLQSGISLSLALGLVVGVTAPMLQVQSVHAQNSIAFSDVSNDYWAAGFIQELATRDVIKGFPDGSFRPNEAVTRAQFAAMIRKAFNAPSVRGTTAFTDVSTSYWGYQAIQNAYTTGFLAGYPSGEFRPNENIPRAQAIVSLSNGLRYTSPDNPDTVLQTYRDGDSIPNYARSSVAAATTRSMVVNYPDINQLNPNRVATRAEVAAFIYQALNTTGQTATISSPYIVGYRPTPQQIRIAAGTSIPVRYDQADRILLGKNEPQPSNLTVTVAQNIVTSSGKVIIPAGSQVEGQLVVSDGAAQFISKELVMANGTRMALSASSEKITEMEVVRKGASAGTIVKDAALGAAAAAGIAAVTGDRNIKAWEVLTGAGVGAIAGVTLGGDKVELISIKPNTDLNLELSQDLILPQ